MHSNINKIYYLENNVTTSVTMHSSSSSTMSSRSNSSTSLYDDIKSMTLPMSHGRYYERDSSYMPLKSAPESEVHQIRRVPTPVAGKSRKQSIKDFFHSG